MCERINTLFDTVEAAVFSLTVNKWYPICSLPPHSFPLLPRATSFLGLCTCGAAAAAAGGSLGVIGSAGGGDRAAAAGRPGVMADRKVKSEVLPGCHSMSSSGHTRRGTDRAVPDCTGRSSEGATSCQKGIILPEGPAHQLTISEKILPVSTQHCLTSD
ncbi:uncharacterized protein LOC135102870 isoform X2 [Scylla paramamosain]|uniref:uncharacterized protein LOC135102870 isoform X2 n=1 Tax=Scylla paramamosain TaxID=85552 RepID=UPI003082AF67